MSHGNNQLDMAGTLTTNLLFCHLHTATVADDTFITDTLVLAAGTLIVLGGTKDALTEQTIALRLVSTVVDSLGFGDFAVTALEDVFGSVFCSFVTKIWQTVGSSASRTSRTVSKSLSGSPQEV